MMQGIGSESIQNKLRRHGSRLFFIFAAATNAHTLMASPHPIFYYLHVVLLAQWATVGLETTPYACLGQFVRPRPDSIYHLHVVSLAQ